jgi:hypothetical protein
MAKATHEEQDARPHTGRLEEEQIKALQVELKVLLAKYGIITPAQGEQGLGSKHDQYQLSIGKRIKYEGDAAGEQLVIIGEASERFSVKAATKMLNEVSPVARMMDMMGHI